MRTIRLCTLALLAAVAACSSAPTPDEQIDATERAAMTPLKQHYPDVIMGFDFHGTSVDVSVDLNAMNQMDDPKEDAMKLEATRAWRAAWLRAHPHEHAKLTLKILDFRGNVESTHEISA